MLTEHFYTSIENNCFSKQNKKILVRRVALFNILDNMVPASVFNLL